LKALAAKEDLDPAEISRLLPLACLSPDIVEAILAGRQPGNVTVERLKRLPNLPLEWSKQHQLLGCRSFLMDESDQHFFDDSRRS
jgi:site-specific DNA recombinase